MVVLLFACTVNASSLFKNASPAKAFGRSSDCNQTSYLKIAKLQYVSSGFRCWVITGPLMRLY